MADIYAKVFMCEDSIQLEDQLNEWLESINYIKIDQMTQSEYCVANGYTIVSKNITLTILYHHFN